MGCMEVRISKPGWKDIDSRLEEQHRVAVSASTPLLDADIGILGEGSLVSTPHLGRWMVDPSTGLTSEGVEDLTCLHSLLPESLSVQATSRLVKRRVGKERLHKDPY